MFYLYRRNIISFGHNDGDEITDKHTILLDHASSASMIQSLRDKYQHAFYKQLWCYKDLTAEERQVVLEVLGSKVTEDNWESELERISVAEYKKLEAALQFNFTKIIEGNPQQDRFYPLIKHQQFSEFGLDSKYYHDMDHLPPLLISNNKQEAFEKGVLYLLLTNDVSHYIGDPETTPYEADFRERYAAPRKKMLDYFSKSAFPFLKKSVSAELISRHQVLKFWILENPYFINTAQFEQFLKYKEEILKDKLDHFNRIVELFMEKKNELIEVINIY